MFRQVRTFTCHTSKRSLTSGFSHRGPLPLFDSIRPKVQPGPCSILEMH